MDQPGSRPWFEAYLKAFNDADFNALGLYYDDDIEFYGQIFTGKGRESLLMYHRLLDTRLDEQTEARSFIGSPALCAVELRMTLHAREDWPDFPTGPIAAGTSRSSSAFVFYDIRDGRFARIRSARFRRIS